MKHKLRILKYRQRGFSLLELAIVLVILGLLLGGLLLPITTQVEQRNIAQTKATIETVKEALLGYAMANGRFPCPAVAGATAVESFAPAPYVPVGDANNGICSTFVNGAAFGFNANQGFVPGVTLGITPTDNNGYVLDAWNNPIRYAIAAVTDDMANNPPQSYIFTRNTGMKNANVACALPPCTPIGMPWISTQDMSLSAAITANRALLSVCLSSTGITNGTCNNNPTVLNTNKINSSAVLVVYSLGKNFATGGIGNDEAANLDADAAFIDHEPFPSTNANGEYDDIISWLSPSTIFNRMVQAGQLP